MLAPFGEVGILYSFSKTKSRPFATVFAKKQKNRKRLSGGKVFRRLKNYAVR